jgi:hypothetical protein
MITLNDIGSAMPAAEPLFPQLEDLYGRLPQTQCTCDRPGICCKSMPEMTILEALIWIRLLQGMSDQELTTTFQRFAEFFLTNLARLSECPFLKGRPAPYTVNDPSGAVPMGCGIKKWEESGPK